MLSLTFLRSRMRRYLVKRPFRNGSSSYCSWLKLAQRTQNDGRVHVDGHVCAGDSLSRLRREQTVEQVSRLHQEPRHILTRREV